VARQRAPVLGANGPYLEKGGFQFAQSFRYLNASRHFSGTKEQTIRRDFANQVHNEQRIVDFGFSYGLTERTALTLSIPYLLYGSWSVHLPIGPPFQATEKGPRYKQSSEGLGDVSLLARRWMFEPATHADQNVALGLGVKAPTGDHDYRMDFPDLMGKHMHERSVDQSIQPGDGGWGAILDLQGFKRLDWATLFVFGTYLLNPRNTNGTDSVVYNLIGPAGTLPELRYNSVPDQYLFVTGFAVPIPAVEGLSGSLAWRIEGVPAEDLIGDSEGWRRPGYATFIEPGLVWSIGAATWSVSLPYTLQQNRVNNFLDQPGDATFADWMLLIGFQFDF